MADKRLKSQIEFCSRLEKAEKNFKKSPRVRITKSYLETRIQTLQSLCEAFKTNHIKLIEDLSEEQIQILPYFTEDKYDWFEEIYTSYMSDLQDALEKLKENVQITEIANMSTSTEIQLPRIQLPNFNGKYEEWQTYYDMFVSLIHKNEKLSKVQKLHYLKSSVSGEPEQLLRNFSTTEQNYDEAWNQLTRRYANKRYNSNAVFKILFSQKQINGESALAIKQLLDTTTSCLKALKNMEFSTESWDPIIIYMVISRLDVESHKQWENQMSMMIDETPTWSQLVDFLEARFRSLEMVDAGKNLHKPVMQPKKSLGKPKTFHAAIQEDNQKSELTCVMCSGNHYLNLCNKFSQMSVQDRRNLVQTKGLCFNCLKSSHVVGKCRIPICCKKCSRRHHTMLHYEREGFTENTKQKQEHTHQPSTSSAEPNIVVNFSKKEHHSFNVLLATAVLKARSSNGNKCLIRALLDQGSQASFVTEATVQLLGLKRTPVNGVVSGLGEGQMRIKHVVNFCLESRHNPEISIQVTAYVLGSLTSLLPCDKLDDPEWFELKGLVLADPDYTLPGKIDVLLGAEVHGEVLLNGLIKHPKGNLIAQNTVFGWVLSGKIASNSASKDNVTSMHLKIREPDDWLKKFWELEAEPDSIQKKQSKEEETCENFYEATTTRNDDGRFVVRLPFRDEDPEVQYGQSLDRARKSLAFLEKRLGRNPQLYEDYKKVLAEYVSLDHMDLVKANELNNEKAVYLPHHAVVREDKETTKVRVVFNASSKGNNGVSLNDNLLVGPKLQQDLRHLIMRWRAHRICLIADLVKMYRQVRVHDDDTNFQRILWRAHPDMPIQHYKLLTLTFGTACAPYLAVKTLQRLAEEEETKFPVAAEITRRDFYVDDMMTGCSTEEEAKIIYEEMNELMSSGGFQLQKWSSNCKEVLQYIDKGRQRNNEVPIKMDDTLKVLGIQWNKTTDHFEYTVNLQEPKYPITKRQVLSDIARLYDPMGWIAPVVVCAKLIIQKIWKAQLDWDDDLTEELREEWLNFREKLKEIMGIGVPRWIKSTNYSRLELHAFSDASRAAYGAAVYVRVVNEDQSVHVTLVSAKTKVAPLEKEMSIPRLELCGAHLAAKLLSEISQVMNILTENLYGWTDSTIVLAWLKGGASKWTTFVSNRVSGILSIMDHDQWRHVSTDTNPADCASRGLQPSAMTTNTLWWNGPDWLRKFKLELTEQEDIETHEEERKTSLIVTQNKKEKFEWERFSNLRRMLKVISFCRRVLLTKTKLKQYPEFITVKEMNQTLEHCIRQVQSLEFEEEIQIIKKEKDLPKKSVLHTLCPILDKTGILRVGGRIDMANVSFDMRHPIIMPAKNHLTQLLVADAHIKTLHGGPQIMLNYLRSKYWIVRAREQVKKYYRKCTVCTRHAKAARTQLMGQLPQARLTPAKPFTSTGVDYAGPINIRFSPGRGAKSFKGYICLFVCMTTRAVHLEAVTDLTSKGFIAAFRRFTSRRGHCKDIFSDNGTNFVGADKQLQEMFDRAKSSLPNEIAEMLTLESTTWHFIPPQSPNFGGLWEAGVRSVKGHLRKVIGDSTLTYEELATVLSQVEACLNSRPLSVLSDNVNDPLPLTPGHFLVGVPILNVNDENYSECNITALDRWRIVQKMVNIFWKRWSKEYLVTLSQRYKWNSKQTEPNVNDVVLVRDDNIPPCKWIMGIIVNKHVGPDNVTRVVTIKCKNGFMKRPLSKICVLPK